MCDIKQKDKQYVANTYARYDVNIVSGKGATCYDEQGNEFIDLGSGIGVNSLGYADEQWSAAVAKQAQTLQHTSNLYYTKPCVELAQKLCDKTGYKKVFFGNSGAEANEGAIKVARKYSFDTYPQEKKRNKILTLVNSFHGRTITTLSATGQDVFHNYFFPFNDGFDFVVANDIASLHEKIDDTVCAIMIEFVQGEGGVIPLTHEFVQEINKVCKQKDLLLIADEVQTGVGRTGKFLASEHYNVFPNITTLAKGLGGGLPIGAFMLDYKVQNVLSYSDHGTTYGGNPIACAGANVVIDRLDSNMLEQIEKKSQFIIDKLNGCDEVDKVTGLGLMLGITLKSKTAKDVVANAVKNHLLLLTAKEKVRLLPPLTISCDEIQKGIDILIKSINE